jgi:hypothetical protein
MSDTVDSLPAEYITPSLRSLPGDLQAIAVKSIRKRFKLADPEKKKKTFDQEYFNRWVQEQQMRIRESLYGPSLQEYPFPPDGLVPIDPKDLRFDAGMYDVKLATSMRRMRRYTIYVDSCQAECFHRTIEVVVPEGSMPSIIDVVRAMKGYVTGYVDPRQVKWQIVND